MDPPTCVALAQSLEQLLAQLSVSRSPSAWQDVRLTAEKLADILRIKDSPEDNHTALGQTALPQTIASLLACALDGRSIPSDDDAPAVFSLFRVAANFCMDHDDNRGHLLEASLPQAIVSLLEGYSERIVPPFRQVPLSLSIIHLKVIRTAIGVLLNASINYDPVKFRLISLECAMTILKLSVVIYPPGSWANLPSTSDSPEIIAESWVLRSTLSNWVWRLISELKDVRDESRQILGPDVLPFLVPSLLAFIPPFPESPSASPFRLDSSLFTSLVQADFDVLEESCMLIESLALDMEDVRLSLARGFNFPAEHGDIPCLSRMLDFVEKGDYHPFWSANSGTDEAERRRKERSFDICKAAIVKVVVEVAGDEKNEEVLWDDSEKGGQFVNRMVKWIKDDVARRDTAAQQASGSMTDGLGSQADSCVRDDLVICATLSLGNLARREQHAATLLTPPHSLAPVLSSPRLLCSTADIKLKHGVLGLTKHLAQSASQSRIIHTTLTEAGLVQRIAASGVWDEKADVMADVIQLNAIGVVKHLCRVNVENTFALVVPVPGQEIASTGLAQILEVVRRSDSVAIKSEGTRVLVNVIKSLLPEKSNPSSPDVVAEAQKRQAAVELVLNPLSSSALASLVARSGKYPMLINEGVVALTLLSTRKDGAALVLDALLAPIASESAGNLASPTSPTSDDVNSAPNPLRSRSSAPRRPIDTLVSVLKNVDIGSNIPPEIRANVCLLILHLGKHLNNASANYTLVKEKSRPALEGLAVNSQDKESKEGMLAAAAQKVLDAWA